MRCVYIGGIQSFSCVVRTSLDGVQFVCDMRIISSCKGYQPVISQVVGCDVRTSLGVSIVRHAYM